MLAHIKSYISFVVLEKLSMTQCHCQITFRYNVSLNITKTVMLFTLTTAIYL